MKHLLIHTACVYACGNVPLDKLNDLIEKCGFLLPRFRDLNVIIGLIIWSIQMFTIKYGQVHLLKLSSIGCTSYFPVSGLSSTKYCNSSFEVASKTSLYVFPNFARAALVISHLLQITLLCFDYFKSLAWRENNLVQLVDFISWHVHLKEKSKAHNWKQGYEPETGLF